MICRTCKKENNRRSDYCSRGCYGKVYNKLNEDKIKERRIQERPKMKEYSKKWYQENKQQHADYMKRRMQENPNYMKEWHKKHFGYATKYMKEWHEENPTYIKQYKKDYLSQSRARDQYRYKNDVQFKLRHLLRDRIKDALKNNTKGAKTMMLLGINSIDQFKQYLESLFMKGMDWSNFGKLWEIDHIKPCVTFDLSKIENQKECFHYTNQRPLWKTTEIAKQHGYDMLGNKNRFWAEGSYKYKVQK